MKNEVLENGIGGNFEFDWAVHNERAKIKVGTATPVSIEEFIELSTKQLFNATDTTSMILKGHILVEYILNAYLCNFSNHRGGFPSAKFGFGEKLHVYRLLAEKDYMTDMYTELVLLNKLRNEIAHTLSYSQEHLKESYGFIR